MNEVRTGPGPFLVKSLLRFGRNQGWELTQIWEGTETECRNQLAVSLAVGAANADVTEKGDGSWQLTVIFSVNPGSPEGNFVDTLELELNVELQHWTRAPSYRTIFADYDPVRRFSSRAVQTLAIIDDCATKFKSGQPTKEPRNSAVSPGQFLFTDATQPTPITTA